MSIVRNLLGKWAAEPLQHHRVPILILDGLSNFVQLVCSPSLIQLNGAEQFERAVKNEMKNIENKQKKLNVMEI